jgi:AcrR family transcriptional regulator
VPERRVGRLCGRTTAWACAAPTAGRRAAQHRRPLKAAKSVFGTSGVDAPAKEIAALAGVGVRTLYRHFPQRSDLVMALFRHEVDARADAAPALAAADEGGGPFRRVDELRAVSLVKVLCSLVRCGFGHQPQSRLTGRP